MLFSDRAEAMIKHNPPIVISTHPRKLKNSEFPDRIFGLRQTDNLRCSLDSLDKRHMESSNITLRNSIELSPFGAEPEPLLFPFFMIEAKSSQGADRAKNLMQSAFCLRRLLKIQHDLVIATDEETQWATGPLIWFLTTRGEQWDVYAGFVEEDDSEVVKYVGENYSLQKSFEVLTSVSLLFICGMETFAGGTAPCSFCWLLTTSLIGLVMSTEMPLSKNSAQ